MLDTPEIPVAVEYLWVWFVELSSGRQPGAMGAPAPLSWEGIDGWARMTGQTPSPWDISILKRLDEVYMESLVPKAKGKGTPASGAADGRGSNPRRRV